ncbi:MAG: GNAT family N-acetyltransferase [Parcubacteria group bacterium]|nr:GNAT family N-acetyltransferase [Parcubacteria group bacterium]
MSSIEKIKTKKSSSKETRLWKLVPEEPARIRQLNPYNIEDFKRYKQMDRSAETQQWMIGEAMTDEEIKEAMSSHSDDCFLYAVSGEKSKGELEGWIQLLPEEQERIERIKKMVHMNPSHLVLELSYARYNNPDVAKEKREKGLISSGVRQIGYSLGWSLTEDDRKTGKDGKPSLKPKLIITAYTDPDNQPSERVLTSACFKNVGKIKYELDSKKYDNLWILNWKKLADFYAKKDEAKEETF